MNDAVAFTKVTQMSQTLEQLLEKRFQAQGRGLHEKLSSVETKIPEDVRRKIRFIATMRNKATHEDIKYAKQNFDAIQTAFQEVMRGLKGGSSILRLVLRKLFILLGMAAIFFFLAYFKFFK